MGNGKALRGWVWSLGAGVGHEGVDEPGERKIPAERTC